LTVTGFVKGLIISVVVLVVVIAIGIGAGIYWLSTHGGEFLEKTKQSMIDGRNFGKTTDNQGCVTETISRYKQSPGFSAVLSTQLFLQGCLQASRETPGFCDNVPKRMEFMKSAQWQAEQCSQNNLLRDSYCPQIFAQVQTFCEVRRPSE
jgi:hypothetical protein